MKIAIYLIRNKVNNRCYVGRDKNPPARYQTHMRNKGAGSELIADELNNGYTPDDFEYKIKCYCDNYEDARFWEDYYIERYDAFGSGYNKKMAETGRVVSKETRRKLSEANMGREYSEETRQRLSESQKKRFEKKPGTMKGKKHTIETKRKMKADRKGRSQRSLSRAAHCRRADEAGQQQLFQIKGD